MNAQQKLSVAANNNNHRPRANSSAMGGCGGKKTMSAPFGGMINSSMAEPNNNSGTAPNPTNDLAKQTAAVDQSAQQQQQKLSVAANKQHEGGLLLFRMWNASSKWTRNRYYDEVSDGFYGTRGWRKRRPEWGTVEQMKGMTAATTTEHCSKRTTDQQIMLQQLGIAAQQQLMMKQKTLEARTMPSSATNVPSLLAAPQQLSKFTAAQQSPPDHLISPTPSTNIKYYDPATDGFYRHRS
uniref:Uncharacterized protein n=1 Tax=Globodera rostochiensis TaxID=31243 RepID=A0A914I8R0_GLORO